MKESPTALQRKEKPRWVWAFAFLTFSYSIKLIIPLLYVIAPGIKLISTVKKHERKIFKCLGKN